MQIDPVVSSEFEFMPVRCFKSKACKKTSEQSRKENIKINVFIWFVVFVNF